MGDQRTHHATTTDGVAIGGTAHGEGPPVVFWHGAYGDGDLDWAGVLPFMTDRFTCHLPSWRGRSLSGDDPDLSYGRRVADVLDYVLSLGEPTALVGWSGGASPALVAAAESDAVRALALVEPTMGSLMTDQERAGFGAAVAEMGRLAAQGRLPEALRAAAQAPFSEAEIAAAEEAGYFEAAGRHVPNLLSVLRQLGDHQGPMADDPSVLAAVSAPVLVVYGAETKPFWIRSARHVADHTPRASIHAIPGAGHAVPLTHPEALGNALSEFFGREMQPT